LADEPTGNLDPDLSREILGLLYRQVAEGMTMLIATHEWELVRSSGCRTIRLEEGKMIEDTGARAAPWSAQG
ncbi:MAG: cell division ATP-binding protein FtsE, partial [Myxococcales bacterium]|nr:cell division ATP-binding protein FtsE [Myxococcales bacterium]